MIIQEAIVNRPKSRIISEGSIGYSSVFFVVSLVWLGLGTPLYFKGSMLRDLKNSSQARFTCADKP